jgi:threonine synthase
VVQARRAKVRPVRVIIPLVVAAALLVGGSFAAWKYWPGSTTAGPQAASSSTITESQAPSTAESSPSPSPTTSVTASAAAAKALDACQERVRAADAVLKEGETGVKHWAAHVQAQKDYFSGKATVEEMKAQFKKTRLKGPGDLNRYNDALSTYDDLDSSCGKVAGAGTAVAASLKKCNERSKDQQPVLEATAAGMKDWKAHQKFMQRNAQHAAGSPSEAQAIWLKQYRAAPKSINAFKKATAKFDAPRC